MTSPDTVVYIDVRILNTNAGRVLATLVGCAGAKVQPTGYAGEGLFEEAVRDLPPSLLPQSATRGFGPYHASLDDWPLYEDDQMERVRKIAREVKVAVRQKRRDRDRPRRNLGKV